MIRFLYSNLKITFEIKEQDYYEFRSSSPTKNTIAEPFYAIMTFKFNVNNGNMVALDKANGILLFRSKSDAEEWRKTRCSKEEIMVGIDRFYWDELKNA